MVWRSEEEVEEIYSPTYSADMEGKIQYHGGFTQEKGHNPRPSLDSPRNSNFGEQSEQ